ncbi:hypothetical protein - conserved [Leishmania donovani]|uniref:Hypothetical_protein_conserved n=1 Tax=Leishmania donovani TaxID=5661 RepID=A0A504X385_LEIDO|nr:hypothetical protein CGC20_7650 [Leishmania donovani]CAJ1990791.1 hypothetical protein - conserved [Leishmania donovani]VDZ46642.1 hypothetical_protein_conserved [Leishmania donovani]
MPRDDFDRRRLRALYERNRRRVSALADARDRRRGGEDDYAAPRRYVVSERRTRIEGFGRGGAQVSRVVRRARGGRDEPRSRRFSDRGIFRRNVRDRFRRVEDFEREERRERFREVRARRGDGRRVEGRRFGEARRLRLRMRGTRAGRVDHRRAEVDGRRQREERASDGRRRQESGRRNNNNQGNRGGNKQSSLSRNNKPQRSREPQITREELDRQLESYRS